MSRDWIDSYISKISEESYDIIQVRKIVDSIMRDIAERLSGNNLPTPKYFNDENKCVFADCIITFEASGKVLKFHKKNIEEEKTLATIDISDRLLNYAMLLQGQKEVGVVESVEDAIEGTMSFLLVKGRF
ncbi:hypothetical protein MKY34_16810 [Sporosarcina sp. FSL K6-1522]|uniref:hypothetical protein n=1 Tax=Sporosarcina sp. FSL K6-1522 TaxID=2921554 RepID=UPI00315A5608